MSEDVELLEEQKPQDDEQQRDPALDWFLTHCHLHKYPAKSTLIHAGEDANILYFLIKGTVMVSSKDGEGKEMILSYLGLGNFLVKQVYLMRIETFCLGENQNAL